MAGVLVFVIVVVVVWRFWFFVFVFLNWLSRNRTKEIFQKDLRLPSKQIRSVGEREPERIEGNQAKDIIAGLFWHQD